MIAKTGVLGFDDINTELGLSSTANGTISARLATMGSSTDPDKFSEARGYDKDFPGWLEVMGCTRVNINEYQFTVYNHSPHDAHGGTLYYQLKNGTPAVCEYYTIIGSVNAASYYIASVLCTEGGNIPDNFTWRFDSLVPYNIGGAIVNEV